ncbi:MAG: hypothetical protein IKZ53_03325 [Selenomonadaceae bacterium]|nr:hypothetical protein [Selenomonadaceae bacterium]
MADIKNEIKNEEKLTDEELDKVAGGTKYYSTRIYERCGILTMDGGKTFMYGNQEIDEQEAASIAFYMHQFPKQIVNEKLKDGIDDFLFTVTNYRIANATAFEKHYLAFKESTAI